VLQNFAAYRVLHLKHHGDLGGPLDPDHYANYTGRPRLEAAMHWGRLLLGYPAYVSAIPFLGWQRGAARDRLFLSLETLAVLGLAAAAWTWAPHRLLLHGWLVPMLLINTLVNIRGMSQHTGLAEPTSPVRGSRTFLVGPVVEFFMCSENFHLEHHLFPRVPWYSLRALHAELRPRLEAERAPFTPGYLAFVRDFVGGRFRSAS
jgi:fatty acid desaturase